MKNIILIILLWIGFSINSQEKVLSFINDLKTSSSEIKDVIPIVDEQRGNIAFFVADAKNVYGYKINADFKVVDKMISDEKSRRFKILVGYDIIDENNYSVILTNTAKKSFLMLHFSFETKEVTSKEFTISNNEEFIQTSNINNRFQLITSSKTNDHINIYHFKDDELINNIISTSGIILVNYLGEAKSVTQILNSDVERFKENIPNTIENTSKKIKMFERENGVLFSINVNNDFTQLLYLDYSNYTAKNTSFDNPLLEINKGSKKSNSYLNGDNVFIFSVAREEFSFEINSLSKNELIKSYSVNKDQEITIKNTPIIQEGGIYDGYRELDKTKQFIRKIYNGNIGVSVRKHENMYHVVLGGYVLQKSSGMMMPMGFGIPIASVGSVTIFYNPALMAYNSFSNNKATRIESLFDEDFNHLSGEIPKNAFDKMEDFKSNKNNGVTVFEYQDGYIKTDYNSFTKNFVFRKFTN